MSDDGLTSPVQNTSIRSPMDAKSPKTPSSVSPNSKMTKLDFSPSPSAKSKKDNSKPKAESGASAAKKSKAEPKTPKTAAKADEKAEETTTAKKRKPSASATATKKKKIEDLEATETELKASLEKLRKEKGRQQAKVKTLEDSYLKYPIKDELLFNPEHTKGKARKVLPPPNLHTDQFISEDITADVLLVWDFLNVFNKQLSLNAIDFGDFCELLNYTGSDSVALTEILVSLLRLVLSDTSILSKLNNAIPRKANFAYRSNVSAELQSAVDGNNSNSNSNGSDDGEELSIEQLNNLDSFDALYNGFKLLPKKIRADHVTLTKYQSILRCILLRLEPVKRLRNAVLDVTTALQTTVYNMQSSGSNDKLASTMKRIAVSKSLDNNTSSNGKNNNSSNDNSSNYSVPKTPMVKFSNLLARVDTTSTKLGGAKSSKKEISYDAMSRVMTPGKKASGSGGAKNTMTLDKDAIFRISSDVTAPLEVVIEAAVALEQNELYALDPKHKIIILKVLVESCYETSRIAQLLERNAEEKANQVQSFNKALRDSKQKLKDESIAKRPAALELCRKINKQAAEALANSGETTKGKKKSGGSAATTGAKGKELYEPSVEQLQNMIDELVLIESLGIDEVVDDFQPEVVSEDEEDEGEQLNEVGYNSEEEEIDGDYIKFKRPRRSATQRIRSTDKRKQREQKLYRNQTNEIANYKLSTAMESNSEKKIRDAIRAAEKSGWRYTEKGKHYCTQKLKQAYKYLSDLEVKAAEDRAASQHERAMQEYFVRSSPIGSDRFNNQYWCFVGDDRLFVQFKEELPLAERTGLIPPTSGPFKDEQLTKLYSSRPNRYTYKWSIYSSATEFWHLYEALDDRGERESALKAALKARFEITEPAAVYMKVGSEYIGKKVIRSFGNKRPSVIGTIVGWLPEAGEDVALYHVVHVDGDEEDLELAEVEEFLLENQTNNTSNTVSASNSTLNLADSILTTDISNVQSAPTSPAPIVRTSSRASLRNANNASNNDLAGLSSPSRKAAAVARVYITTVMPHIVKSNSSISKGHVNVKLHQISVTGLKADLNATYVDFHEVLKRLDKHFDRDGRKLWETNIRNAETVDDMKEPLLELEELCRGAQSAEDKRDQEEFKKMREKEYSDMKEEGWIFDATQNEILGSNARRFFKGFGQSDGVVVAFLPADKNDGIALYHLEHNDGDVEDLEEEDAITAIKHFVNNATEDDSAEQQDGEEEGEESSGEEEESEDEEPSYAADGSEYTQTLWPTYEIRTKWREAVKNAYTVGELSLALHALVEHATMFGLKIPEETPEILQKSMRKEKARIVSSTSTNTYSTSSSSRNGSGAKGSTSRGNVNEVLGKRTRTQVNRNHFSPEKRTRSQRSATRRAVNYNDSDDSDY